MAQLFLIVKSINAGEPFGGLNLFMASGSLCTLTGQALLLYLRDDYLQGLRRVPPGDHRGA